MADIEPTSQQEYEEDFSKSLTAEELDILQTKLLLLGITVTDVGVTRWAITRVEKPHYFYFTHERHFYYSRQVALEQAWALYWAGDKHHGQ